VLAGAASAARADGGAAATSGRRLRPRQLWLIPGLAIAILGSRTDSSLAAIGVMVAFGIAPHFAFLAGIGQPHPAGGMAPRARAVFNALHRPIVPVAIVALNMTGLLPSLVFVAGTAWLSHIVIGWAIGDGLRTAAPAGAPQPMPDLAELVARGILMPWGSTSRR
jgi:hypothetical protein